MLLRDNVDGQGRLGETNGHCLSALRRRQLRVKIRKRGGTVTMNNDERPKIVKSERREKLGTPRGH